MCFYLLMGSVLVVHVLLDFGSLFLVVILHLGMLAAVLLADYRHRLYRRCRLHVSLQQLEWLVTRIALLLTALQLWQQVMETCVCVRVRVCSCQIIISHVR
jgi:hypothetical protein